MVEVRPEGLALQDALREQDEDLFFFLDQANYGVVSSEIFNSVRDGGGVLGENLFRLA